jgi:hypothetical protein
MVAGTPNIQAKGVEPPNSPLATALQSKQIRLVLRSRDLQTRTFFQSYLIGAVLIYHVRPEGWARSFFCCVYRQVAKPNHVVLPKLAGPNTFWRKLKIMQLKVQFTTSNHNAIFNHK